MLDIQHLINIFVVILIILLIWKYCCKNHSENFAATAESNEAIQNLASMYQNGTLNVTNVQLTGKITGGTNYPPIGTIVAWYNAQNDLTQIPAGWALCNGTNGTPDLRGRFILSSNPANNQSTNTTLSQRIVGTSGGEENHMLTVNEMPSHHHTINTGSGSGCTNPGMVTYWNQCSAATSRDENIIGSVGGSQAHNNMPPYYVLNYIMRIF